MKRSQEKKKAPKKRVIKKVFGSGVGCVVRKSKAAIIPWYSRGGGEERNAREDGE